MKDQDPSLSPDRGAAVPTLLAAISLSVLTGCQEREPSGEAFSEIDSAGVAIVESNRPLWEEGEGWTLSPEPELVIGQVEGDEEYLLSGVTGVRRVSDGRIAILEGGSNRVRLYDSAGRHLMDLGGEGDGPSEFRWPQFLGSVSDTLFVFEYVAGELTWFSPGGEYLRTSRVFDGQGGDNPTIEVFGYLENGLGFGFRTPRGRERTFVEGLNRPPIQIWRFDLFSVGADSLFSVPGHEGMISFPGGGVTGHHLYVFGKTTRLATSRTSIYVAPTDEFSIQVFDQEGILKRIIRRIGASPAVSARDFDHWVDQRIEILDPPREERAELTRSARELSHAENMPAFHWIAADSEDNLWVEEWEDVGLDQGRFSVFRSDGAWLGYVEVPEGLPESRGYPHQQMMEIGSDYLLGVWTDDYGVEQIRLYRIMKE